MCKVILACDSNGREHIEGKAKEDKKRAKRKEKKKAKKLRKSKKKSKKGKDDTSASPSSDLDSSSSSLSSSSSSSSSSDSAKKKKRSQAYTPKAASGGTRKPEFKIMDGVKYFKDKAGSWNACDKPPKTPCRICGGFHWWWEGPEHGCRQK